MSLHISMINEDATYELPWEFLSHALIVHVGKDITCQNHVISYCSAKQMDKQSFQSTRGHR